MPFSNNLAPLYGVLSFVLILATAGPLHAEEQTTTYHLFGFSHPEREPDLKKVMQALPAITEYQLNQEKSEITLRFDPLALYPVSQHDRLRRQLPLPEKMIQEQLSKLLKQASRSTFDVSARSTIPEKKLTRVEIPVNPLDCKACRLGIYNIVAKTPGVSRAAISTEPSAVSAWIDPTKTSREALIEALTKKNVPLPE